MPNPGEEILRSTSFNLGVQGARTTQRFAASVADLGLGPKQVGVLAVVAARVAGSQREIATALGVAPSLVVGLVDGLVAQDLVTRTRSETDRRVQTVALTARGRRTLATCRDRVAATDARIEDRLGPARARDLARALAALDG